MIEGFEYASDADLLAAWSAQTATLSLSSYVSPNSAGTNSMRVDVSFPGSAWATEILTGPTLTTPLAIASTQYLTLRISGDPQFINDTFNMIYLYAYDGSGNFGRWGRPVPTTNNWQVFNFVASSIEQPWDSPALPDFNNIVQFKFFIYGQGSPAGAAFSATIYLDDVTLRNTALIETPPPTSGPQTIEDFEEYATDGDLQTAWAPDMDATLTLSSYVAYSSKGTNSMRVDITVPANDWQTTVLTGPVRPVPMAIAPTQYITFRLAGDPSSQTRVGSSFTSTPMMGPATSAAGARPSPRPPIGRFSTTWRATSSNPGTLLRFLTSTTSCSSSSSSMARAARRALRFQPPSTLTT